MTRFLLLFVVSFLCLCVQAQQEQQYSLYMINPFAINPAIAGTEGFIDVNLGFRNQWTGFEGAPYTAYVTGHMAIGKEFHQYHHKGEHKAWHGIGAQAYVDQAGPLKRTALLLAYAFNMPITKKARLSVGVFFGGKQLTANASYWKNIDDISDPNFSTNLNSGLQPDLSLGLSFYHPKYYFNFSTTQLLANKLNLDDIKNDVSDPETLKRHFFTTIGYKHQAKRNVYIMPSMMFKYVATAPVSVDLNLKMLHNDLFWYGVSYRIMESFNVFAGMQISHRVDITYAFEWSTSKIGKYIAGTHEIVVALRLQNPKVIECPSKYW